MSGDRAAINGLLRFGAPPGFVKDVFGAAFRDLICELMNGERLDLIGSFEKTFGAAAGAGKNFGAEMTTAAGFVGSGMPTSPAIASSVSNPSGAYNAVTE